MEDSQKGKGEQAGGGLASRKGLRPQGRQDGSPADPEGRWAVKTMQYGRSQGLVAGLPSRWTGDGGEAVATPLPLPLPRTPRKRNSGHP